MSNTRVYTLGHSNRSLNEFINILLRYKISVVVDVRRFPSSRRYPYFSRETLERVLSNLGIKYVWLGDLLGGFRSSGYESYIKSEEFRRGFEELIKIIKEINQGYVAILCRERLWFKCHRRFISNELTKYGIEVIHIIEQGKTYKHKIKTT